jgi:sigma-B regulation protein RsbU (phosphoserine phosphatase)
MTFKTEFTGLRQRLADLGDRFDSKLRGEKKISSEESRPRESIYSSLRDLFTQDVTGEGLNELVKRDLRETFHFFTRAVDFASLRHLPWYKRYPAMAWKTFLAIAYRLSPPRRIAFAISIFAFIGGSIQLMISGTAENSGVRLWLLTMVIVSVLLFMELRDKLYLKGDLEIAREIQFGLVPSKPFQQDGVTIHCHMRPANTVGGDYYDIIEMENRNIAVVMGDVAGKGMPAALLMALLQGSLRTLIAAGLRGPELFTKLNAYLYATIPTYSLVTLFHGELNTTTGEFRYVNAGHNAPFLLHGDQTLERLDSTSIALGLFRDSPFEEQQNRLGPGDHLLLFTDGISEAFNTQGMEYGEDRLGELMKAHSGLPQTRLIQALVSDVLAFCGDARPVDDMTLMSIGREA